MNGFVWVRNNSYGMHTEVGSYICEHLWHLWEDISVGRSVDSACSVGIDVLPRMARMVRVRRNLTRIKRIERIHVGALKIRLIR